jgi:crotonobetainyl-CoA:carnitine CoA-transferase CaiB-like acyl-CoA transferase
MSRVLEGVRVIDFGRYIAGPYCASLLADLGAEVIRVERVGGGEDRAVVALAPDDDGGATFLQMNRNKKSLAIDLASPAGRRIASRLIATADIVVANLPPQALVALGLDYEALCGIKPDIILTTINAFGSGGPWSHRVGFDGVAQAMSGLVYRTGQPGAPQKAYGPWVDFSAGAFAAFGTLAALLWRRQTGAGQHVESSMLMAALAPATTLLIEQAVTKVNRQAARNRSQTGAPADMFRTKDGWLIVQVVSQSLYKRWARLMGEDIWLTDPRFKDDASRVAHGELLSARMAGWCAERTNAEALEELDKAKLPAGPTLSPQEVLDHEHIHAIGAFAEVDYPGVPLPVPLLNTPVTLSATPAEIRVRAPQPGEHTITLLTELGYAPAEIDAMRQAHTI